VFSRFNSACYIDLLIKESLRSYIGGPAGLGFFLIGNYCKDCDMKSDGFMFIETIEFMYESVLNKESVVFSAG
jgi:hypothetical protein